MLEGLEERKIYDGLQTGAEDKIKSEIEKNEGRWNAEQHKKYVIFVEFFKNQLNSRTSRKSKKIYKIMAAFIKTRDAGQCRCHHTKLIRTFKFINKIIESFQPLIVVQKDQEDLKKLLSTHSNPRQTIRRLRKGYQKTLPKITIPTQSVETQTDEIIAQNNEILCLSTPFFLYEDEFIFQYLAYQGPCFIMMNE